MTSNFAVQYYLTQAYATDFDTETYQEKKWQANIYIYDANGVKTAYDITTGMVLYADLRTTSYNEINVGRYEITNILSYSGNEALEVELTWANHLTKGGYAPDIYVPGILGTTTTYGELYLPDKDMYTISSDEYTLYQNMNNLCIAYYIENNTIDKVGSIVEPLICNTDKPNIFTLTKIPIPSSIKLEINNINYSNTYFEFIPETMTIEWKFTKDCGGFDIDNSMNVNAVYNYLVNS